MSPDPLFCRSKDFQFQDGEEFCDYYVAEAVGKTIGSDNLTGVQPLRFIWKIYVRSVQTRVELLSKGINFRGRNITVYDANPDYNHLEGYETTEKVTFRDLPLNVPNSEVKDFIESKGITLASEIKYGTVRTPDGYFHPTIKNGDRYVYVKTPLPEVFPKVAMIDDNRTRINHRSQSIVCKACHRFGHKAGEEVCTALLRDEEKNWPFRGFQMPLSNMWKCIQNFTYMGKEFDCTETAFQWKKAIDLQMPGVAARIYNAPHGGAAKRIADRYIPDKEASEWSQSQAALKTMEELLTIKADIDFQFLSVLQETGDKVIVEATSDVYWGSGIADPNLAASTSQEFWIGQNILGAMLMDIRRKTKRQYLTVKEYEEQYRSDGEPQLGEIYGSRTTVNHQDTQGHDWGQDEFPGYGAESDSCYPSDTDYLDANSLTENEDTYSCIATEDESHVPTEDESQDRPKVKVTSNYRKNRGKKFQKVYTAKQKPPQPTLLDYMKKPYSIKQQNHTANKRQSSRTPPGDQHYKHRHIETSTNNQQQSTSTV